MTARQPPSPRVAWPVALAIGIATFILYAPATQFDWVNFDDDDYVVKNPDVRAGLTPKGALWAFTTTDAANWHPLTWLSLMLDVELFNADRAAAFHRTNIILHALASTLLFVALQRMTGAVWRSALVAGLFSCHPLHVESVAWIAERKDVLSTCFWMAALVAYGWYAEKPALHRYVSVLAPLGLGLMAKPMLVTFPAVLSLLDYWPLARYSWQTRSAEVQSPIFRTATTRELILEKLPLWALAAAACFATLIAQSRGGTINTLQRLPLGVRLENATIAYVVYLGKMFWPTALAPLYPHSYSLHESWRVAAAAVFLLLVTGWSLMCAIRYPYFPVGWFWYLGTLIPVIGLVQAGLQAWADRYTYIPLIGPFLVISWYAGQIATNSQVRWLVGVGGAATLLACALATREQMEHWRNSLALWQHSVTVTPDSADAQNNLGQALGLLGRTDEALRSFERGLKINAGHPKLLNNTGHAHAQRHEWEQAEHYYRLAAQADPNYAMPHVNLGRLAAQRERYPEAKTELERAIALQPRNAIACYELGNVYFRLKQWDEAIRSFRAALCTYPAYFEARLRLGLALEQKGAFSEALEHFRQAQALRPDHPEPPRLIGRMEERLKTDGTRKPTSGSPKQPSLP